MAGARTRQRLSEVNGFAMKVIALVIPATALAACAAPTFDDVAQSTVFARPRIVYQSGDSIGVEYLRGGIMDATNQRAAVALIEEYCKGKYRVVGRNAEQIDARCVR